MSIVDMEAGDQLNIKSNQVKSSFNHRVNTETSSSISVLLIEDSLADIQITERHLNSVTDQEFNLKTVGRLAEGFFELERSKFDVVLLDLNLPDSSGMNTLIVLRKRFPHLPVVVFTGHNDSRWGLEAIKLGAQDCLIKGNVNPELLEKTLLFAVERSAVVRALSKPVKRLDDEFILRSQNFEIDFEKQQVAVHTETERAILPLTPLEFKIFVLLYRQKNEVISRGSVVSEIWGEECDDVSVRTVDKHMSSLKRKCAKIDGQIQTVYGIGYKLLLSS